MSSLPPFQNEVEIGEYNWKFKPDTPLVPLLLGVGFPGQPVRQLQELTRSPWRKSYPWSKTHVSAAWQNWLPAQWSVWLSPTCPVPSLAPGNAYFQKCQGLGSPWLCLYLWSQLYVLDDVAWIRLRSCLQTFLPFKTGAATKGLRRWY